jgi:hypothetical protein
MNTKKIEKPGSGTLMFSGLSQNDAFGIMRCPGYVFVKKQIVSDEADGSNWNAFSLSTYAFRLVTDDEPVCRVEVNPIEWWEK